MKNHLLKVIALVVLSGAVALAPTQGFAQDKKKKEEAAAEKKDSAKEGKGKRGGLPARGKVVAVDKTAKTIKVGERTFHVTSETRIQKTGKPATLDDAVVGENVGIFYKEEEGKLVALTLRFGPQPEGKAKGEGKDGEKKEKKKKE